MLYINMIAVVTVILFLFGYKAMNKTSNNNSLQKGIWVLLSLAFAIRLLSSIIYKGFSTDMNCFNSWAIRVADTGFSGFYSPDTFTDYPPGYMYILWVIGWIIKVFHLEYMSNVAVMLIKLPAMLCDIATAYIIYKVVRRKLSEEASLLCTSMYLFNPAIVVNSTIWGQVDSVLTLCIVLMCYYIWKKKQSKAIIAFAIGMTLKPQMAIVTPILLFACLEEVFVRYEEDKLRLCFNKDRFFSLFGWSIAGIGIMALIAFPFGIQTVIKQYTDTMGSYEFASVNAYNMWTFFDKNWVSQNETFLGIPYYLYGYVAIVITVLIGAYLFYRSHREERRVFLVPAFIILGMFMFSVRMHERYMYPALALLLLVFALKPNKKVLFAYGLFSLAQFYNVSYIMLTYPDHFRWEDIIPNLIGLGSLIIFGYFVYVIIQIFLKKKEEQWLEKPKVEKKLNGGMHRMKEKSPFTIMKSEAPMKLLKIDLLIILVITLVYSAIAFYDLGNSYAPETGVDLTYQDNKLTFDFGEQKSISKIAFYLGHLHDRKFSIEYRNQENEEWTRLSDSYTMSDVFRWAGWEVELNARYVQLVCSEYDAQVNELIFFGQNGEPIVPVNASEYSVLFDEQSMYDERASFRSGTYFDEIYHARTAYEYTIGVYSYENTHPPLGKIIISLGIVLFGMNPFGWRVMGTLFGALMLPFIYLFAKRLFKERWVATLATIMMAADFMHFAQTRIATIDVYVTFFIICMYYFMYKYTTMSFNDTKLSKTFVPLALSGTMMGCAIASKMTGVYAGVGLAIIFFLTLYRRVREYLYAKKDIDGESNGISHREVVEQFSRRVTKTILFCVLVFVVVPAIIYTLSYLPFVNRVDQGLFSRMIENQFDMFNYHSKLVATHPFSSWWYEWPIIARPIWYYSGEVSKTVAEGISSFGNPLIWWLGIPAFFYMIYEAVKRQDRICIFLIIGYLAQYVPWMLVPRITFIYHYFPSVPFVILMIAYAFYKGYQKDRRVKQVFIGYVIACCILFAMFYPVLSGHAVEKSYVNTFLRWFDSWVLLSR